MSSKKYPVGARVLFKASNILGTVVENYKFKGGICVLWDNGQNASYDEEFLDAHTERAMVTEVKPWGAMGFVAIPGERGTIPGRAYTRVEFKDMEFIGHAVWIPADEA